jgi:hypothetical protein
MPTILNLDGYRFFFFAREGTEPPHIHVEKAGHEAKFWLEPPVLARNHGFPAHELRTIKIMVAKNHEQLLEAWNARNTR